MTADVTRIAFAQREYRYSTVEDLTIRTKHPLADEVEFPTLLTSDVDATAFGNYVLSLRKLDRWTWACYVSRENYPSLEVGQTVTLAYPRFGFSAGKNFIIKRIKVDSGAMYHELTLFGPQ